MPYLVVGGVTVSVAAASRAVEEIGDRARAFDGTKRSTIRSRKYVYSVTTVPMADGTATTLEAALNGSLPVACSGDLTGSINAHPEVTGREDVMIAGGFNVVLSFALHQV